MRQFIALITVFITLFAAGSDVFARGGSHGGGGNVCYRADGSPVLLELMDLIQQPMPGMRYPEDYPKRYGSGLERLGFEYIGEKNFRVGRITERIDQILDRNRATSPLLTAILDRGLVEFAVSSFPISIALRVDAANTRCPQENIRASVIYLGNLDAIIDLNAWNRMDLDSQTGVYFHENLRVFQRLSYGLSKNGAGDIQSKMSDGELQDMVAQLFRGGATLDNSKIVQTVLLNTPIRIPTDDEYARDYNLGSLLSVNSKVMSCRASTENSKLLLENIHFRVSLKKICNFYKQAHTAADIQVILDKIESEARTELQRTGSASYQEVLREIAGLRREIAPARRMKLAAENLLNNFRGSNFRNYFYQEDSWLSHHADLWMALDLYTEAAQEEASPASLPRKFIRPLNAKDRQRWQDVEKEACSVRENMRDFMATGSSAHIDPKLKLKTPHARCGN